ncbi:hypothetical protein, partial [Vibrio parahaemolyticus]|uniref:hypothetical protein n=1 Tax=Vibrio parahaemolyticus TaxID=670 RepID=UPI001EDB6E10
GFRRRKRILIPGKSLFDIWDMDKNSNWFQVYLLSPNAQLRGEARNDQAAAWHFNTETTAY